jgi:hypothetical protein
MTGIGKSLSIITSQGSDLRAISNLGWLGFPQLDWDSFFSNSYLCNPSLKVFYSFKALEVWGNGIGSDRA